MRIPIDFLIFLNVWSWISVSRALGPVLGRKLHVDFESDIKSTKFLQPEWKT